MVKVNCSCPFCQRSLMDAEHPINGAPSVALVGRLTGNAGSSEGIVRLSAYYGDYTVETALVIPTDMVVDFFCPYCRNHLNSSRICELCRAPMTALMLNNGGKIQFCSRRGCEKHFVEFEDPEAAIRAFNQEYSPYPD